MKINNKIKQLSIYLLSNVISIGVGKLFIPTEFIGYWIFFCVFCGYFINKWTFKQNRKIYIREKTKSLPDDIDIILMEAERLGWVFNKDRWMRDGWSDKSTQELYDILN